MDDDKRLIELAKAAGILGALVMALWAYGQVASRPGMPEPVAAAPATGTLLAQAETTDTPPLLGDLPPPEPARPADAAPDMPVGDIPPAAPVAPPAEPGARPLVATSVGPDGKLTQSDPGEEYYRMGLYEEALALWQAAAEDGDANAAYRLAVELYDGKPGVTERDVPEAVKYYELAAAKGDARAQFDLAGIYEDGQGVPPSLEKAAEFYGKAAASGLPEAQWNYATMLERGEGVPQDNVKALTFYLLARAQGFTAAPVNEAGQIDQSALMPDEALRARLSEAEIAAAIEAAKAFAPAPTP